MQEKGRLWHPLQLFRTRINTSGRTSNAKFLAVCFVAVLTLAVFGELLPLSRTSIARKVGLQETSQNPTISPPSIPSVPVNGDGSGRYSAGSFKMTTDKVNLPIIVPAGSFDSARLKLQYDKDPDELFLEMFDARTNSYIIKPVTNKALNSLRWYQLHANGLTLWQRTKHYHSVDQFLQALGGFPNNAPGAVAVYCLGEEAIFNSVPRKNDEKAHINVDFRGPHTFYIYACNGYLTVSMTIRDMNWAAGGDPLDINVYSGEDLISSQHVPDDGNASSNFVISKPRNISFSVPKLAQGIYKLELSCDNDVVISNFYSSSRYVMTPRLFIVNNEAYHLGPTRAITVFTNAKSLLASSWHSWGLQTLNLNGVKSLKIDKINRVFPFAFTRAVNGIGINKGDVILEARDGFLAFSSDCLFKPFQTLDSNTFFSGIDYLLATYTAPERDGKMSSQKIDFDLRQLPIPDQELSFILYSPNLSAKKGEIAIKSIEITLEEKH